MSCNIAQRKLGVAAAWKPLFEEGDSVHVKREEGVTGTVIRVNFANRTYVVAMDDDTQAVRVFKEEELEQDVIFNFTDDESEVDDV